MLVMSEKGFDILNKKLDKLIVLTAKLEEHQASINGSIVELKREANERVNKCGNKFKDLECKINHNENSIVFAKGSIYALTLISICLGLLLGFKTIGII